MFRRAVFSNLIKRLKEPRRYIQVLAGPRQVGKTTTIQQVLKLRKQDCYYVSADDPTSHDYHWIEAQWQLARLRLKQSSKKSEFLLVLDEIQKITQWSEIVKKCWDQDTRAKLPLKVVLLGSSPLLIQRGLTESLAGRFEILPVTHWSFEEIQEAFGLDVNQYIYFGGYPGAAELINDENRWRRYIIDSLIETTISKDILLMNPVNKPALLRRLFHLGCQYSGQILSYQKMLGQLQEAGNTTTLAHYLELLSGAGMLTGISKFAGQVVRQRASSPKFQVLNTALFSAQLTSHFDDARMDHELWGRLVESAIGAYLLNSSMGSSIEIFYWREGNVEVDFVLRKGKKLIAIEVKSGRRKDTFSGLKVFEKMYKPDKIYIFGNQGIGIEECLSLDIDDLF